MTTINPVVVAAPPFADLYISDLPPGTARIEVTRLWRGVARRVRGDRQAAVLGSGARLVDWALPVSSGGTEVTYSVAAFSETGAMLGEPSRASVAAPSVSGSRVWLSDPHDPSGAILVMLLDEPERPKWAARVEVVQTMTGRPIAIAGGRASKSRGWHVAASTVSEVSAVDRVLDSGVLLLRGDADLIDHETGLIYTTAPEVTRWRPAPLDPWVTYQWSGVETRGPGAPVAVSRRTYQDDLDEASTYADALALWPTYLDRVRAGL